MGCRSVLGAWRADGRTYAVTAIGELGLHELAPEVIALIDRPRGADPVAVAECLAGSAPRASSPTKRSRGWPIGPTRPAHARASSGRSKLSADAPPHLRPRIDLGRLPAGRSARPGLQRARHAGAGEHRAGMNRDPDRRGPSRAVGSPRRPWSSRAGCRETCAICVLASASSFSSRSRSAARRARTWSGSRSPAEPSRDAADGGVISPVAPGVTAWCAPPCRSSACRSG